jgi:hypothetical protein
VLPDSSGNSECGVNCRRTAGSVEGTTVCISPQCAKSCSLIASQGLTCTSSAECHAKPGYECSDCVNDPLGGPCAFCAKRCTRNPGSCPTTLP